MVLVTAVRSCWMRARDSAGEAGGASSSTGIMQTTLRRKPVCRKRGPPVRTALATRRSGVAAGLPHRGGVDVVDRVLLRRVGGGRRRHLAAAGELTQRGDHDRLGVDVEVPAQ